MHFTPVMILAVSLASLATCLFLFSEVLHRPAHVSVSPTLHSLHQCWRTQNLFGALLKHPPPNRAWKDRCLWNEFHKTGGESMKCEGTLSRKYKRESVDLTSGVLDPKSWPTTTRTRKKQRYCTGWGVNSWNHRLRAWENERSNRREELSLFNLIWFRNSRFLPLSSMWSPRSEVIFPVLHLLHCSCNNYNNGQQQKTLEFEGYWFLSPVLHLYGCNA